MACQHGSAPNWVQWGGGTTFTTSAAALEPGHCGVVASTSVVSLYTHYMRHHTPMERYYCKILSPSCEITAYWPAAQYN